MTERGALLGGRYMLDQIIGRGGMAEVWRARDTRLERDVAVKRLRVDLASDATFQARFRREAQSAAGLNHPNIVAVYDTGEERDTTSDISVPYIVMELVEGVTLREVLRDGRKILPERALEFSAGVLDALAYSHRAGIIHRDIKPANVMLTPGGTVKVMDFGIARAVSDTSATMTQTAAVIGTAQYLSPEQARGEKVDNRSDIYSVGCLLYELLTSEPLFKGDSPVSVAYQHVREAPVPPSQLDDEVTPAMDAVVLKSLAKDPRDRYQDASEFRDDVLRAMRNQPVHAANAPEPATRVIASDPMTTTARRAAPVGNTAVTTATPHPPTNLEEREEEEEKKSRKGLIALLVVAGVVLLALGLTAAFLLNPGSNRPTASPSAEVSMVAVPAVVGDQETSAKQKLEAVGLKVQTQYRTDDSAAESEVLSQDPGPDDGQVEAGTTVTIVVSAGPEAITIPESILNVPVETAKQLLRSEGFTNVSQVQADPASEPADAREGDVISANPAVGTKAAPNDPIELTVATGNSLVPQLVGLTQGEAEAAAAKAGFELTFNMQETNAHPAGKVFEQSVEANTPLARTIELKATIAVEDRQVVPKVTDMTREEAEAVARDAGYTISFEEEHTTDLSKVNWVFQQNPAPGSPGGGTTITAKVWVSPPTSPTTSPSGSQTP